MFNLLVTAALPSSGVTTRSTIAAAPTFVCGLRESVIPLIDNQAGSGLLSEADKSSVDGRREVCRV